MVVATGRMRMQQPDGKPLARPPGGSDEQLPQTWRGLLQAPRGPAGDDGVGLGFFLGGVPEEGGARIR